MIPFPNIDPVAIAIGPLAVRWYSLAYLAGIVLGWYVLKRMQRSHPISGLTDKVMDDVIVYATLGIIAGGRLLYCLVYNTAYYVSHPLEIFHVWQGGMSFHGGMLGAILGVFLLCRKHNIAFFPFMDRVALVAPMGLFFGRIANFINGELYGRVTDVPWAMIFPHGGELPRHPSQLYQAGMEGLLLGLLMIVLWRKLGHRSGAISGVFLIGYGLARMVGELFREPDIQMGFLLGHVTTGQLLSMPMVLVGAGLFHHAVRTRN